MFFLIVSCVSLSTCLEKEKGAMNRPVCYERAQWEWNTDMYVPQYPEAEWFRNYNGPKVAKFFVG